MHLSEITFGGEKELLDKKVVVELLKNNICQVSFTKLNGEHRDMDCTLRADLLPSREASDVVSKKRIDSATSVRAFDLKQNEWRAFRLDGVKSIKILSKKYSWNKDVNPDSPRVVEERSSMLEDDDTPIDLNLLSDVIIRSRAALREEIGDFDGHFDGGGATASYEEPTAKEETEEDNTSDSSSDLSDSE